MLRVGGISSLAIAIPIVDPYQATREGQYLAEGDEYAMMYLRQRRGYEPRRQQDTSKSAQYDGYDQLNILFHRFLVFIPTDFTDFHGLK